MNDNKNIDKTKKVYQKPRLRTIELAADEVLAAGCKNISNVAPAPPHCMSGGCSKNGS
jgi:hypothetical protein